MGFFVRGARKEHGLQRWVEGPVSAGDRVLVLEDTVTSGGSTVKAIERIAEQGLEVAGTLCVVDRLAGGGAGDRGSLGRSVLVAPDDRRRLPRPPRPGLSGEAAAQSASRQSTASRVWASGNPFSSTSPTSVKVTSSASPCAASHTLSVTRICLPSA